MSWYSETEHGEMKKYLEWSFGYEMIPSNEPLFFRKNHPWRWNTKEAEEQDA